ncbi:MAG: acyloxyacyl hydrolase [Alphaproteobacteria bacterium]|nr:acyloxyacyl hydrolase [Alphaproteobacteria bacterium]
MKKFVPVFLACFVCAASADENPFFNGYENQVVFNLGIGTNHGFLISPPTQFVPFAMGQFQYSQPATFFRIPARMSLNVFQTLGYGERYGWDWRDFTIPIVTVSGDISLVTFDNWNLFMGFGAGFQVQQNDRIGSKLIFGFKVGGAYSLTDCSALEFFIQHMSNGNTAPENNSYAFYGVGFAYNF